MTFNHYDYMLSICFMFIIAAMILLTVLTPFILIFRTVLQSWSTSFRDILAINSLDFVEDFPINENVNQWAEAHGFIMAGTFYFKTSATHTFISVWKEPHHQIMLLLTYCRALSKDNIPSYELRQEVCIDFSTSFSSKIDLNTTNAKSGHCLPTTPNTYKQVFPTAPIDVLYRSHNEAIAFLTDRRALHFDVIDEPFDRLLLDNLHEGVTFWKSIPLWQIRCVFWYCFRRFFWQNLTVEEQFRKGKIKLPA